MNKKFFFAGSGGQGILLMGQMLATAGLREGKEVTFLPSYGPEMRGGTANCTVIVADAPINCPLIYEADVVVAMNLPSLIKFESLVKPNGMLFVNSSLASADSTRADVEEFRITANETAISLGNERMANMVMMGLIIAKTGVVAMETIEQVLATVFSGARARLLAPNQKALAAFSE